MEYINIATEDLLSEAVAIRLIQLTEGKLIVSQKLRKNGFGYLKSKFSNFCKVSAFSPVLIITDLDRLGCAPTLIALWSKDRPLPPNLLFRIAVREIESWLIADHDGMRKLIGKNIGGISENPDLLPDPKATLLKLAEKAPSKIKNGLIAKKGSLAIQGVEYNIILSDFVRNIWNPSSAAMRSDSLKRAIKSINELAGRL